jgi:hypothetical protein
MSGPLSPSMGGSSRRVIDILLALKGGVEEDRLHLPVQCAVCISYIDAAFDEAIVGFDRQPVSRVFGNDDARRTLDSFRFCLCLESPLGALELSRVQLKMLVGPRPDQGHTLILTIVNIARMFTIW